MTLIIDHRRPGRRSFSPLPLLSRIAVATVRWISREIDRRRTFALLEMDDRMLTDIGVSRGDVHAALMNTAGDKPSEHLAETRRLAWMGRRAQVREARASRWSVND